MRRKRKIEEAIIAIVKEKKEEESIVKALELIDMDRIIKEGDVVAITPNWVKSKPAYTATVVGPETLRTLIRYVKNKNPKKIYIAVGSGGDPTPKVLSDVGYDKIIKEEKVTFIDLNYGPYVDLKLDHMNPCETKIHEIIDEIDVLISFTQLKQHEEATMSAGIKNIALGWPPAEIHGFPKKNLGIHNDLHGFIVAMAKEIPIDITIVSADKTMIGTGPSDGKAVDVQGLIIAGTDPVATDTICARMLGFLPQGIHYLYQLYNENIGVAEPEKMILKGIPLEEAEMIFSKAVYNYEIVVDKNKIKKLHGNQ